MGTTAGYSLGTVGVAGVAIGVFIAHHPLARRCYAVLMLVLAAIRSANSL